MEITQHFCEIGFIFHISVTITPTLPTKRGQWNRKRMTMICRFPSRKREKLICYHSPFRWLDVSSWFCLWSLLCDSNMKWISPYDQSWKLRNVWKTNAYLSLGLYRWPSVRLWHLILRIDIPQTYTNQSIYDPMLYVVAQKFYSVQFIHISDNFRKLRMHIIIFIYNS